ncbi:MAG: PAS domain S-box protein, partial [Methylobacterium sp.]|nr:PAS domain S-box protein [Methylobacterium sp.]
MKINLPVTNREIELSDDSAIVSKTDRKGAITFANPDFIEISGFTEQELLGANHNIVRHPDMPPAAFEDLWNTVKAGKAWNGMVKNRCKNGDHYWVDANITPIRENGEITGYISVRKKPSREQIDAAEALYQQMREGTSFAQRLRGMLKSLKSITIKTRIIIMILVMVAALADVGYSGMSGMLSSNASLETVYKDRVIPLQQIKRIADLYAVNIVDTSHKVRNGNLTWEGGLANVDSALKESDEQWRAYISTFLVEDEKKLVAEAEPLFAQAKASIAKLRIILQTRDSKKLQDYTINELYPAIDPLSDKLTALVDIQLKVSAVDFEQSKERFASSRQAVIATTLISILIAVMIGWMLYRAVVLPIRRLALGIEMAAQGEISSKLQPAREDEIAEIIRAYKALQTRLTYDLSESRRQAAEALRVKIALDNVATNVMIADNERNIIYMNKSIVGMM